MLLKSFGCSFIFGTDLADSSLGNEHQHPRPSHSTWPALLARHLGLPYRCHARGGSGNLQILDRLSDQLATRESAFYVIGWTWIDRFDYIKTDVETYSDDGTKWSTVRPVDKDTASRAYYKYLHSEHQDKFLSLLCIKSAIDLLKSANQPFIMTCIDDLILDQRWNCSPGIIEMQEYVRPYLTRFDGLNFLDYSKKHRYLISPNLHPLEDAHQAAAHTVINMHEQEWNKISWGTK